MQRPEMSASGSGCCIIAFNRAPHPNAAKLFLNWYLSKKGQTLIHKMVPDLERQSLREDIPLGNVVAGWERRPGVDYFFTTADPGHSKKVLAAAKDLAKLWEELRR